MFDVIFAQYFRILDEKFKVGSTHYEYVQITNTTCINK